MTILINYFIEMFNCFFSVEYFLLILFGVEFLKMFMTYYPKEDLYAFTSNKQNLKKFKIKWFTLIFATIVGAGIFLLGIPGWKTTPDNYEKLFLDNLIKLTITYSITISLYSLLFSAIINKIKAVLSMIGNAEVKQKVIDVNSENFLNDKDNDQTPIEEKSKTLDDKKTKRTRKTQKKNV